MDDLRLIDLREEPRFTAAYVCLRNRYTDLLLSAAVGVDETLRWLQRGDVTVRCLVRGNTLLGAAVLYLHREGEIALFTSEPGRGVGGRLLWAMEKTARERGLRSIWGWVLEGNARALKAFEKSGFVRRGMSIREFRGERLPGVRFDKGVVPGVTSAGTGRMAGGGRKPDESR